jgi:hypothetical protein
LRRYFSLLIRLASRKKIEGKILMSAVESFLAQSIQGYNVTDLAKWVAFMTYDSITYGFVSPALVLAQWGWESGWGGADIATYFNPGNQDGPCSCGSLSGAKEPTGIPGFSSIRDGVNSYANLLIKGYPHVTAAYRDGGFSLAAQALGQGYYTGYTGGKVTFCGTSFTLTSSSGAHLWAQGKYGSPAGSDLIGSLNAHTSLQALDTLISIIPE